jgi:hypothetical protein
MNKAIEYFRSEVPEGTAGPWVIEKVAISEREYDPDQDPRPHCFKFRPGVYTSLRRNGTVFMTDLYDEWWTQCSAIAQALTRGGEVLITGLGLGLVAEAILRPADSPVEHVTILEVAPEVIKLVGPYLERRYPGKITIVETSAFAWTPPAGRRFSVGWHDIWPDPYTEQNRHDIEQLENRYRQCCDWQGNWPAAYQKAATETPL